MDQKQEKGKRKFEFIPKVPKRNGESVKYINPVKNKKIKLDNLGNENLNDEDLGNNKKYFPVDGKALIPSNVDREGWVKWSDRIVMFNALVLSDQIKWLKENIFIDDKNFFYYIKKHNEKMVLMVVREAARCAKSYYKSMAEYYHEKYVPDLEIRYKTKPLLKWFQMDMEKMKEKNNHYRDLSIKYNTIFKNVNRYLGVLRYRLIHMDASLVQILNHINSEEELYNYFYLKCYKTITVNY
jgi:hypothetical protein